MKSLRLYHLLFAAAALVAYFSAEEFGLVHAWAGYGIAALIGLRVLLGLAHARGFELHRLVPRFSRPSAGMRGLRHPAISRGLTAAILLCVAGAAGTGIGMDRGGTLAGRSIRADDHTQDNEEREDFSWSGSVPGLVSEARAEDSHEERSDEDEGPLSEAHELFGSLLLPLAIAHALYLLLFRFELARFMLFSQRRRA